MNEKLLFARPGNDGCLENGQLLEDHLKGVANICAASCKAFDSEEWGLVAGLLHDLGKAQKAFQDRLTGKHIKVEHSSAGAALSVDLNQEMGTPLAFAIAGHHTGLANLAASEPGQPAPLTKRLETGRQILEEVKETVSSILPDLKLPDLPRFIGPLKGLSPDQTQKTRRKYELWIRFLFSALVDADRLDAAAFGQPEESEEFTFFDSIDCLKERLDKHIDDLVATIPPSGDRSDRVNGVRKTVLDSCRSSAVQEPGIFSLTVPTGGGKTLSSMSFALRHAAHHELARVIVVIPYTSIIEQNASVYRLALGSKNVIEHHSNLDPQKRTNEVGEEIAGAHEVACENWDAPVIVTTSVQFFETLFSNRASRCRKLHNVANSVIILDEIQTLPPGYLEPLLETIQELADSYGCSVVLSTATPPALVSRKGFRSGLKDVKPIIVDPASMSKSLERVAYHWPPMDTPPVGVKKLAEELSKHERVLAIVHRRADARDITVCLSELTEPTTVEHLSALMCPDHRNQTIKRIHKRLEAVESCRVVSTQLVEAGVDLDFPVIYRALGGLDSVAQAAGRCNREGRLAKGDVHVFLAESKPPAGTPRRGLEVARSMLESAHGKLDLVDPGVFDAFFRALYFAEDLDSKGIQALRQQFDFATVGDRFRLIEDGFTQAVVVPYGESPKRLEHVHKLGPSKDSLRGLQPFLVSVYPKAFGQLLDKGAIGEILPGLFALERGFEHLYDEKFGLVTGDSRGPEPERFIV